MLIAFEGLDQSGKETQTRHLRARLESEGHKVHAVSFPDYGTPVGQEIAKALAGERDFSPDVMQLLYVANRFEYKPRIESWQRAGSVIVCDRYRASSVAYGEAHGLDPVWLDDIQRHLPESDLTLLLDIAPEVAARRKEGGRDVYERDLGLLARVRDSYLRQAARHGWVVVDAAREKDAIAAEIAQIVLPAAGRPAKPKI